MTSSAVHAQKWILKSQAEVWDSARAALIADMATGCCREFSALEDENGDDPAVCCRVEDMGENHLFCTYRSLLEMTRAELMTFADNASARVHFGED